MINKSVCRSNAIETIKQRKINAEKTAEKNLSNILKKYLDIQRLYSVKNGINSELLTAVINFSDDQKINSLRHSLINTETDIKNAFEKHGIDSSIIEPEYFCKKCNDSGHINGKACECLTNLIRDLIYREICAELPVGNYTFDNFSLDYYQDPKEKKSMSTVFDTCKNYACSFKSNSNNLLLTGKTGLGKTHLSLAIANEVAKKGYGVVYNSIHNLIIALEKEHFSHADEITLDSLLSCDLLIIDDLGTEFNSPFTLSCIYTILNTRILKSKPIIISTNLSTSELDSRYGERIVSRLFGNFNVLLFQGKDVRIQKAIIKNM